MYQLDPIMGGDRFTQPVQPRVSRLQTVPSFKQFAYNHSAATHQKVAEWADSYFQPLLIVYGTMRYHNIRHDLGVRILIPFPTYPPRGLKPLDGTDIAIFLYERWSKRKNAYFNEHPPNALKIIICRGETTSDWQVMHNTFPVCVGLFAEYPRLPQATKYAFHSCSSAPEQCRPFWEDESHSAAMFISGGGRWVVPRPGESTLVFGQEDLRRIWRWEIESGHYPSSRKIPEIIGFKSAVSNPALAPKASRNSAPRQIVTTTEGRGPSRVYLDIKRSKPYPPRPVPGSIADLDVVMDHCDFSEGHYVRDCLEVLRVGAGLDVGPRLRRGDMSDWKYVYVEGETDRNVTQAAPFSNPHQKVRITQDEESRNAGLNKRRGVEWERNFILPPTLKYITHSELPAACDEQHPRIFHMFWKGPFTDKPYLALLSFLYTQNLGLHLARPDSTICRPKLWLWINTGPAASIPNPSAERDMFDQLKANPWASPFLHSRFEDVIQFKLWNTTEQLDSIPELKHEWRKVGSLLNSGGHKANLKDSHEDKDASYDRLSTVLSDMARFVLCHRFGGIYLDADTIFLRDWEELWGWNGAFAYRWSRLKKYNTAVLRLNKGSALGSFLFRTALKNGLDFHPMSAITKYAKDAFLEGLLLRLPDALFDSAWLNTEDFQRDRPPQPYFPKFEDFSATPQSDSAAPQAIGFDGFYRGAFAYHYHISHQNAWGQSFDPQRNWPDLGPLFAAGEREAREKVGAVDPDGGPWIDKVSDDKRDLDWSTVLKRTFEAYIRGESPNMYGEYLLW